MKDKIVLIDGNSILNRAFYGVPVLSNSQGVYTNAVYGFLNIMLKILDEEKPQYLTVAFDVKHPTFRHEKYPEYKGTRKPMPEELRQQLPLIKEVLKSMNIKIVEKAGYEADDILGTIAKKSEKEGLIVSLVSGDRDLLQIASDNIMIRIPKTKKGGTEIEDYNTKDVMEKYGIMPIRITDLKGLMGDASDNIPGVPGIGEKTALKILTSFESLENAIDNIENVMPNKARTSLMDNKNIALLSKELATIKIDCELDYSIDDAKLQDIFNEKSATMFKQLEFKSLLAKINCSAEIKNDVSSKIIVINDLAEAEKVFSEINKSSFKRNSNVLFDDYCSLSDKEIYENIPHECVGVYFSKFNEQKGIALAFSDEKIYFIKIEGFITESYLKDKILELFNNNISISSINIKEIFDSINDENNNYINSIVTVGSIFDEAVAAYLINPLSDTYNYDDIANNYIGMLLPSLSEVLGKAKKDKTYDEIEKKVIEIVSYTAYVSHMAYPKMIEELKDMEMLKLMFTVELPLTHTLFDMEKRGIKVNRQELSDFSERLSKRILELELLIYDMTNEKFNINSPQQLGEVLFGKMQMPFAKKTKSGYSTSADILEKLRSEHPVINYILEYRQLTKLKSTYTDGLVNYIDDDQRIRSTFNQTITATGRISSTEPNLQNIPIRLPLGREIRKAFIPEEDYIFVDADYSQIELRVLAHMSNDKRLIKAYSEDSDIHRITASEVFNIPLNEVTSEQRRNAKAVNFGIVYGISSFGLGQDLNITRKEAESYIQSYFATYPEVKKYLDKLVIDAKDNGYIKTLFDRRRPIPELSSSNFMQRSFGERVAMNSPIQGTAADIIKIAMIRVNERLRKSNMKSRLLLQIHDELLIETHKSEIEEVKKLLHDEMYNAVKLEVPLEVDVNQGTNWYEVK